MPSSSSSKRLSPPLAIAFRAAALAVLFAVLVCIHALLAWVALPQGLFTSSEWTVTTPAASGTAWPLHAVGSRSSTDAPSWCGAHSSIDVGAFQSLEDITVSMARDGSGSVDGWCVAGGLLSLSDAVSMLRCAHASSARVDGTTSSLVSVDCQELGGWSMVAASRVDTTALVPVGRIGPSGYVQSTAEGATNSTSQQALGVTVCGTSGNTSTVYFEAVSRVQYRVPGPCTASVRRQGMDTGTPLALLPSVVTGGDSRAIEVASTVQPAFSGGLVAVNVIVALVVAALLSVADAYLLRGEWPAGARSVLIVPKPPSEATDEAKPSRHARVAIVINADDDSVDNDDAAQNNVAHGKRGGSDSDYNDDDDDDDDRFGGSQGSDDDRGGGGGGLHPFGAEHNASREHSSMHDEEASDFMFDRPTVANIEDVYISCDLSWKDSCSVLGIRYESALHHLVGRENLEAAEFLDELERVLGEQRRRDMCAAFPMPVMQHALVFWGRSHAQHAVRVAHSLKRMVQRWNSTGQAKQRSFTADLSIVISSGPASLVSAGQYEQTSSVVGPAVDSLECFMRLHPTLCSAASRTSVLVTASTASLLGYPCETPTVVALLPVDVVSIPEEFAAAKLGVASGAAAASPYTAPVEEQLPLPALTPEDEYVPPSKASQAGGNKKNSGANLVTEFVYVALDLQAPALSIAAVHSALSALLHGLQNRDSVVVAAASEKLDDAFADFETEYPFDVVGLERPLIARVLACATELIEFGSTTLFEVTSPAAAAEMNALHGFDSTSPSKAAAPGHALNGCSIIPREYDDWAFAAPLAAPPAHASTSGSSPILGYPSSVGASAVGTASSSDPSSPPQNWRALLRSTDNINLHASRGTLHGVSMAMSTGALPQLGTPQAGAGASGFFATPPKDAPGASHQGDADILEVALQAVIEQKEEKARIAAQRAAEKAEAAAQKAPKIPLLGASSEDDEDEDGGGFALFSFVPTAAADVDDDEVIEEKETEPKRFTDIRGAEWCLSNRMLGSGAFGNVFLGMGADGQMVAIKAIKISEKSKDECKNVVKEIRLLSRLKSDSIVQYMSSAVVGSFMMIVMEAVGGGSLLGVTQQYAKLPQKLIVAYLRDVLGGLRHLHSNGVVHRDIKPHNVLMTEKGRCKLADFGTACHVTYATANERAGDITGTIIYMAPEACDAVLHVRSDIWSTGIMAYQMACKTLPYHQADISLPFAILSKLGKRDPDHFKPNPAGAPEWLVGFIDMCLTFDPDSRPSAGDLLRQPPLAA